MNVLVTGIDGFVGSHLTELLHGQVRLSGLVIDPSRTPLIDRFRDRLTLHRGDIRDAEAVSEAVRAFRPAAIYHLAGQAYVPNSLKDPVDTYRTNIDGGINVLEAVRRHAPECVVLVVSSGEVYGKVAPDAVVEEESALRPENPYAASKACLDILARQYRAAFGLRTVVARAFNHLGPGQSDIFVGSAFARQVAEAKLGKRAPVIEVGNLDARRDFTDVRDVVRAYAALVEGERRHGVYNVCSGKAIAVREILDRLVAASGMKVEIRQDPARMRASDTPVVVGSPARIAGETGWKPSIPLERTLADLLAYWERRLSV